MTISNFCGRPGIRFLKGVSGTQSHITFPSSTWQASSYSVQSLGTGHVKGWFFMSKTAQNSCTNPVSSFFIFFSSKKRAYVHLYQSSREKGATKKRKGQGISQHGILEWERTRTRISWTGAEGVGVRAIWIWAADILVYGMNSCTFKICTYTQRAKRLFSRKKKAFFLFCDEKESEGKEVPSY